MTTDELPLVLTADEIVQLMRWEGAGQFRRRKIREAIESGRLRTVEPVEFVGKWWATIRVSRGDFLAFLGEPAGDDEGVASIYTPGGE